MKYIFKDKFVTFVIFGLIAILLSLSIYTFYKSNFSNTIYVSSYRSDNNNRSEAYLFKTLEVARNAIRKIIKDSSINFYVSTYGSDNNDGSISHPFKSLEAARDAIRKIPKDKGIHKNINIFIRGGDYFINKSFTLEKIDSINDGFSINYRCYENEKVFFIGGYNLENSDFKLLTDKTILDRFVNKDVAKKILVADLSKYTLNFNSNEESISDAPELFCNNNPTTLARYPNVGFLSTGQVIVEPNNKVYSFKYSNYEPSLWNRHDNIWMSGYWRHNWSDSTVKVSNIDTPNNLISFTDKLPYGVKENQRYYFFNILDELDSEGEYYIDYDKKFLYFLPNDYFQNSRIQLSVLTEPFIKMNDVSNITIEGINFECSRASELVIENGTNNKIKNCVIRNTSQNGISINGGTNNGVENCKIYNTGTGGIVINGGDRNTLTPCNNYVTNNEIYNYSRINKTYSAAINISGIGISASHNSIHDAPHTAILFSGNDHLLEYNEIYNVATETDDVGAIYTGRDWTFRGNKIRYNYLHNIDNNIGNFNVSGVYLDDCMSSAEVYGNVFYRVKNPIFIGGGRDNSIRNNIIVDCKNSINFDERGLTWNLGELHKNLQKVPYESSIWTNKYPELKELFKDGNPGIPNNNTIENNVLYQTKTPSITKSVIKYGTVQNNILYDKNPGFVNLDKLDFTLAKDSNIFRQMNGFENIPFEIIGTIP